MNSINDLFLPYSELETAICDLMAQLFSDTCGMCTACCCRADICEEALRSAFLSKLLSQQGLSLENMDDRIGWLDLAGCTLKYGKPPICYSYFCDQLMARLPDEETRFSTRVLGNLIHHIGKQAFGEWNLVEIQQPSDLEKVNLDQIAQRLHEAQAAFEVIQNFVHSGRLDKSDYQILSLITTDDP